jgi:drug/metabolite transporter (DMT)-like permease
MIGATTILGEPVTIRSLIGGAVVIVALYLTDEPNPAIARSQRERERLGV